MLDEGSLASHSSHYVGRHPWNCPLVKDLIVDVSVGPIFKGMSYLYLTLAAQRSVLHRRQGFSSTVYQAVVGTT